MASLSTCHLGLWLGWQILLNLVKSTACDVNPTACDSRLPPPPPSYKSVLLLTGDRGCGKTSVLANWVQEFSTRDEPKVFAHYVGSSALSFDVMCFMRRCTVEMRDKGPQIQCESDIVQILLV